MSNDDVTEFLMGGGARAFSFDNLGDLVEGTISQMSKRQQTSLDSGKPQYWGQRRSKDDGGYRPANHPAK
jgi:hypothetical protein